jgi:cyclic dehypoxanthinyl futalosine synthase
MWHLSPFPNVTPVTARQAADLFRSNDLIGIGMEANKVRQNLHPEGVVSYTVSGELDLANAADTENILERVRRMTAAGISSLVLTGDLRASANLKECWGLVRMLKRHFAISIGGFSPLQLTNLASASNLSLDDTIAQLRDAGLDSIGTQGMRPGGPDTGLWREAHRSAHKAAVKTTAKIVFETGAAVEQQIDGLETIRRMQDETGGFVSAAPSFQEAAGQEPTAVEYLKALAISRLYLPNILNCENSWRGAGLKVCQVGLRFGGNDLGSVEPVDDSAGSDKKSATVTAGELRRLIRDAGFTPKERDALYATHYLD